MRPSGSVAMLKFIWTVEKETASHSTFETRQIVIDSSGKMPKADNLHQSQLANLSWYYRYGKLKYLADSIRCTRIRIRFALYHKIADLDSG